MTIEPVVPALASTVILMRDTPNGYEVFMVRRHVRSDFAADVYVFPGGKVDEGDRVSAPYRESEQIARLSADAYVVKQAAVRELFEEAGVLLAYERDGQVVDTTRDEVGEYDRWRRDLHGGAVGMQQFASDKQLCYAHDLLHAFSHWITPVNLPRRFDTWFFTARMPDRQQSLHDAVETTAGAWMRPGDALRRSREGDFPLVFATEQHLERLARYATAADVFAGVTPEDLDPVTPKMVTNGGETRFLLPGDPGYGS